MTKSMSELYIVNQLPLLVDPDEATDYYLTHPHATDAERAYVVALMSQHGMSNAQIRHALGIPKVYTVTHLKRAGMSLSEPELLLWHRNPQRITLGHVRAIAKLPRPQRENLLRDLLTRKTPVHQLEMLAQGKDQEWDADIARYEMVMGEVIGRRVKVQYNKQKRTGSLTLDFYTLEDLDTLAKELGFNAENRL